MRSLGISFDTIEVHLNHVIPDVAAVYQRDALPDERKAAVELWGQTVVQLGRRQRSQNEAGLSDAFNSP